MQAELDSCHLQDGDDEDTWDGGVAPENVVRQVAARLAADELPS